MLPYKRTLGDQYIGSSILKKLKTELLKYIYISIAKIRNKRNFITVMLSKLIKVVSKSFRFVWLGLKKRLSKFFIPSLSFYLTFSFLILHTFLPLGNKIRRALYSFILCTLVCKDSTDLLRLRGSTAIPIVLAKAGLRPAAYKQNRLKIIKIPTLYIYNFSKNC